MIEMISDTCHDDVSVFTLQCCIEVTLMEILRTKILVIFKDV